MLVCHKYRLRDQRPSGAIQSFECKIKTFHLESHARRKCWPERPQGASCVILIFCILIEKTPGGLFEVRAEIEGHGEGT